MNLFTFTPPYIIDRLRVTRAVFEAIDNAIEGGYGEEIEEMNESTLAYELMSYVEALENEDYMEVLNAVTRYRCKN